MSYSYDRTAAKYPSARKMMDVVLKEADTAAVRLEVAKKALDKGYDEPDWSDKEHEQFQQAIEYTYDMLKKARHEALKARRAAHNTKSKT